MCPGVTHTKKNLIGSHLLCKKNTKPRSRAVQADAVLKNIIRTYHKVELKENIDLVAVNLHL